MTCRTYRAKHRGPENTLWAFCSMPDGTAHNHSFGPWFGLYPEPVREGWTRWEPGDS